MSKKIKKINYEEQYDGPLVEIVSHDGCVLACGHSFPERKGLSKKAKRARCPFCAIIWRRENYGVEAPNYWSRKFDAGIALNQEGA